jgi:hypothetical protein
VSLPTPAVGQVVQYAYLWQHGKEQGWTDASKDRPAMIMYLHKVGDKVLAAVCPFSTLAPAEDERQASVEIDEATRRGLGLTGRQWARTDQINTFIWAGFDLRRDFPANPRDDVGNTARIGPGPRSDVTQGGHEETWSGTRVLFMFANSTEMLPNTPAIATYRRRSTPDV